MATNYRLDRLQCINPFQALQDRFFEHPSDNVGTPLLLVAVALALVPVSTDGRVILATPIYRHLDLGSRGQGTYLPRTLSSGFGPFSPNAINCLK